MTDEQLSQLPQLVWRKLAKSLSKDDIKHLMLAKPDLLEMDTSLEKAYRVTTLEKVFVILRQHSYIKIVDLMNCFKASPLLATSILPSWHSQDIYGVDEFRLRQRRISPFETFQVKKGNIKTFTEICDQLEDWELLMHLGHQHIYLEYSDELDDNGTDYFREVKFLFQKIGHFISRVSLDDSWTTRRTGKPPIFEELTNLKELVINKEVCYPARKSIFGLVRDVRDTKSLEMFYCLKALHLCPLLKDWISLLPYFITDQVERLESDSTISGLNTVARQLWNVREIDLTVYPGGCKDFLKDVSGFGPNLRKLSLHYLGQCPLVHHMNRFGTLFPSLKEIHLEIKNCHRILTLDNWWPTIVFEGVEKIVLELSEERNSHYIFSQAQHPLPPLKFLTLFPSMKFFHFKFVNDDGLYTDIRNFKSEGYLNDEFKFYDKLETGTVEESKLWDALPKLSIIQVSIAYCNKLRKSDKTRYCRK